MYRYLAAQTMLREAYLMALEPRYQPTRKTHVIDGHQALCATYIELANKLAVFNEVAAMQSDRDRECQKNAVHVGSSVQNRINTPEEEAVCKVYAVWRTTAGADPTPAAGSPIVLEFERINSRMRGYLLNQQYFKVQGYLRLLQLLHSTQVLEQVESVIDVDGAAAVRMVPASTAVRADGTFQLVSGSRRAQVPPRFIVCAPHLIPAVSLRERVERHGFLGSPGPSSSTDVRAVSG